MYVVLLNKLRFDQISCSWRSGTRWQYGVPKWYEIVKRLGTTAMEEWGWNTEVNDDEHSLFMALRIGYCCV